NDAYNANPVSMRAALEALVARAAGARTVAVLGPMAELGDGSPAWHVEVGGMAVAAGGDGVGGGGELAKGYGEGARGPVETHWLAGPDEARDALPGILRPGDVVLLKASRAYALWELEEAAL